MRSRKGGKVKDGTMRICQLGEEVLRKQCAAVKADEIASLHDIIEEMFSTMTSANGVGLAAPQVGITKRFFVVVADDDVRRVFINPAIITTSEEMGDYDEGCLSIPGITETIRRAVKVTVAATNEKGRHFTLEADGLLARVIQHENDHLNGVLYIDRGDKDFAEKTVQQFRRRAERAEKKRIAKEKKQQSIADKKAARARR